MKRIVSSLVVLAAAAGSLYGASEPQEAPRVGVHPGSGGEPRSLGRAEDERAIREVIATFTQAFQKGDAAALARLFTEEGEAIDTEGGTLKGRAAIEEHYRGRLSESSGDRLDVTVESVSFLSPDLARVTGLTQLRPSTGTVPQPGRFTSIFTRREGRWLLAVAHETAERDLTPHDHLSELGWLVGDWVEETEEAVVQTTVSWVDDGNFLLRTFDVRVKGKPALSGTQRIGWDPLTRQIKSWVFDASGGYGEGLWMREGDQWVIKATGVRPDGRVATATQVLTYVNKDSLRWKSIDRTLGGGISQDIDEIVMVRKPPRPASTK